MSDDFVGSEVFFGELLRGSGGADVLGADIDEVSDAEVRGRESVLVSLDLVPCLGFGDALSECGVEFVKVDGEFTGPRGGKVALRVDGESGVVTLVGEEGRDSGCGVRSVVVRKLRKREEFGLVVLLIVAVNTEVLFQGLVDALRLTVAFGVVTGSEVELHVESFPEGAEEVGDKLRTSVGGDVRRNFVLGEDME